MNDPAVSVDVLALIRQGAISTYPLILCSVITLGVAIERVWALSGVVRSTGRLAVEVARALARGDREAAVAACRAAGDTPAARVFGALLDGREHEGRELERLAEERQFEEIQGCTAYLWLLATIGSAAPFIGLFGTVMGIIKAFHHMALVGTGGFTVVAAGISEALIATALGLAVGIMAMVLYNFFQSRVERIEAALRIGSGQVISALGSARSTDGVC